MCQINLTSIQGQSTNGVNASSIVISGTAASGCKTVRLQITGCNQALDDKLVPVTNGAWQYQLTGECLCNGTVKVSAVCCDAAGNPVPGCDPVSFEQQIDCPPLNCCPTVQITTSVGDCNANNERPVVFNVTVTLGPGQSSCPFPYLVQLNYGDGNFGPSWVIPGVGTHSFSVTHNYNANANYVATLLYAFPSGLNCPATSAEVHAESCAPDCCPKVKDYSVKVLDDCNGNCERLVELTVAFDPPAGSCPPAYLEWWVVDKNNHAVNGAAFTTLDPSPQTEQFWLNPANSPYTATLVIKYPTGCGTPLQPPYPVGSEALLQKQFELPACQSPAACPEIDNFNYSVGGCVAEGDKCCREVSFPFDINVHAGCGGPETRVRINYGDGNTGEVAFGAAGPHHVTFIHRYCQEGDYLVTLETLYPVPCPDKSLVAHVPKCDPQECGQEDGEDGDGKFCPCCIGLIFLVTSYFWFWTEGYYQGDLIIYNVNLGQTLGYASALYGFLVTLLVIFCYKLVKACRKCWVCKFYRCLFWALIISIIMIIVMVVIAYYYGNMAAVPGWPTALLNAAIALWAVYTLKQAEPCKTFYQTGKCKG